MADLAGGGKRRSCEGGASRKRAFASPHHFSKHAFLVVVDLSLKATSQSLKATTKSQVVSSAHEPLSLLSLFHSFSQILFSNPNHHASLFEALPPQALYSLPFHSSTIHLLWLPICK
ncbi:hypothetical protein RIF29_38702 [Crotalaria pallida]|uniref:Uncharacterized protein n=1 Tax=Crotalaria pallida TaxID=3830 RepID=A0AAN9DZS7_CROPI